MSDAQPISNPEPSLYGGGAAPEPPKKIGLGEILTDLFTDPAGLFSRLRTAGGHPWILPLALTIGLSLVLVTIWGMKVDVDAMLRPILERNPQLSGAQIDQAIEIQGKFMLPFGILGALFGGVIGTVVMGLIYWGLGVASAEEGKPTFLHGLTMSSVLGLVLLPYQLLVSLVCLLRPVGGLTPEKLSPTSLGYYLTPESPKLYAFFCNLDLFMIASWVLTYVAARRLLRAKPWGAALCVAVIVLFSFLRVVFAR